MSKRVEFDQNVQTLGGHNSSSSSSSSYEHQFLDYRPDESSGFGSSTGLVFSDHHFSLDNFYNNNYNNINNDNINNRSRNSRSKKKKRNGVNNNHLSSSSSSFTDSTVSAPAIITNTNSSVSFNQPLIEYYEQDDDDDGDYYYPYNYDDSYPLYINKNSNTGVNVSQFSSQIINNNKSNHYNNYSNNNSKSYHHHYQHHNLLPNPTTLYRSGSVSIVNCEYKLKQKYPHLLSLFCFVCMYVLLIIVGTSLFVLFESHTELAIRDQILQTQRVFLLENKCVDCMCINFKIDNL